MTALHVCSDQRPHRSHHGCDGRLRAEDEAFVRAVEAALVLAELGPWWHQAAGRDPADKDSSNE